MDISNLRWILIIIGIAIIAGIFLLGNPDKKRKPRASRKRARAARIQQEPGLDSAPQSEQEAGNDEARQTELAMGGSDDPKARLEPRLDSAAEGIEREDKPQAADGVPPDKIITLYLQVRDNRFITGVELLDASLKSGLVFGEQGIFHRIHEEDLDPVFSMANLTNPGTFDKTAWNTIEIKGVSMFMTLPGPKNALDAWDSMLATSRRLAALLQADLLDDTHAVFTRQRALQIKDELRKYERQQNN